MNMKKIGLILMIFLVAGLVRAQKTVPLEGLNKPFSIEVDDKQVYFTDGFEIKIYSLADFKLKKVFGKKGEGPGEFKGFVLAYVQPDYIFASCPNRVLYFSLEGKFIKQRNNTHVFGRFKPLGADRFVGYKYDREGQTRYEAVWIFDEKFEKKTELYRRKYIVNKNKVNLIEERPSFFYCIDERVYLDGVEGEDGAIFVYGKDGKRINTLKPGIERISFTRAHEKRFREALKNSAESREYYQQVKDRLEFPDYFPPIRMFHVDAGKVYIMTNREKDDKNEFIVIDTSGRELKRLFLPIQPFEDGMIVVNYTVKNGKLYHVVDNEETEQWELKIFEL